MQPDGKFDGHMSRLGYWGFGFGGDLVAEKFNRRQHYPVPIKCREFYSSYKSDMNLSICY